MEEASGKQLGEVWDDMELHDKLKIVDDIVAIERKFLSVSFTRYIPPNQCSCVGGIADGELTAMEVCTSRMTLSRAARKLKSLARYHNP